MSNGSLTCTISNIWDLCEGHLPPQRLNELRGILKETAESEDCDVHNLEFLLVEEQPSNICQLENLSDKEKIERFDALYESCREVWDHMVLNERLPDREHFVFEAAMEIALVIGDPTDDQDCSHFWNAYNAIEYIIRDTDIKSGQPAKLTNGNSN